MIGLGRACGTEDAACAGHPEADVDVGIEERRTGRKGDPDVSRSKTCGDRVLENALAPSRPLVRAGGRQLEIGRLRRVLGQ